LHLLHFRATGAALGEFQDLDFPHSLAAAALGGIVGLSFFGNRAPKHQQFTDVLDGRAAQLVAQLGIDTVAGGAVIAQHANLDQPMGVQGKVGFFHNGGREPVPADHHDGIKVVRIGPMGAALGSGQFNGRHPSIIPVMKIKSKSKKINKAWLNEHIHDPYVRQAGKDGYRSRAAYKLKEIDEALQLVRPGQLVVDLGASPGAWSQYLRRKFAPKDAGTGGAAVGQLNGTIIALDLLEFEPIEGVQFILGDFREEAVLQQLEAAVGGRPVDLVVSDMAPNLSGVDVTDAARIEHLVELAIDFSQQHLVKNGALVCKVFHGSGYTQIVDLFKKSFKVVKPIKPKASRDKSSETFLVGIGLKTP
jgi:23S rRNA (uridine2552-2'-O)-methyltransferase